MTTTERTFLFNVGVVIYNIILGLIIETIMLILLLLIMAKNMNLGESIFIQILLPIMLLAGLILAIYISNRSVSWFIKKFKLTDKLSKKVLVHYKLEDE